MGYKQLYGMVLFVAILGSSMAQAATLTWDANGSTTPNPTDGSGTWLTNGNWWNGGNNVNWNSTTPDDASFGVTGPYAEYSVALGGNVSAGSITFTGGKRYNITGNNNLTINSSVTITQGYGRLRCPVVLGGTSPLVVNNSSYFYFYATVSGSSGITITGDGNTSLSPLNDGNSPNTYSGPTTINGGVLAASNSDGLSVNSNLVFGGGVLQNGGNTVVDFTRSLGNGANQVQWTGDGGFAARGSSGTMAVLLNNSNAAPLLWGSTPYFLGNGARLLFNSSGADKPVDFRNDIDLNGSSRTVNVAKGQQPTGIAILSGVLSGNGASGLTKTDSGTLILSGANTYSGDTIIDGGTLSISQNVGSGLADLADVKIASGVLLDLEFSGMDTIRSLYLDGVGQALTGTWGGSGSGAQHQDSHFTGTGLLNVTLAIPEPSTLILLGIGALGLLGWAWRRRWKLHRLSSMILAGAVVCCAVVAQAAFIDMVTVGDAGNTADSTTYGAVSYAYNIGKYEVTNSQYTAFLNAADAGGANANGIYNAYMGSDARGGITFTNGAASGAKYTIRTNMGDKPVNYVSW